MGASFEMAVDFFLFWLNSGCSIADPIKFSEFHQLEQVEDRVTKILLRGFLVTSYKLYFFWYF